MAWLFVLYLFISLVLGVRWHIADVDGYVDGTVDDHPETIGSIMRAQIWPLMIFAKVVNARDNYKRAKQLARYRVRQSNLRQKEIVKLIEADLEKGIECSFQYYEDKVDGVNQPAPVSPYRKSHSRSIYIPFSDLEGR